jgi:hypothetical protein
VKNDEETVAHTKRVVIELRRGEGPMSGRFMAEGQGRPQIFSGWLELLALLETARLPPADAPTATESQNP